MDLLARMFGHAQEGDSADIAKQRLRLVLAQDRTSISSETLNVLKDELITVISKHIKIDRANVQVSITRSNMGQQLVANIPVLGARELPQPSAKRATPRAPSRKTH